MRHYSRDMKEAMVAKLCSPGRPTYSQLAQETGIGLSTLHKWVQKFGSNSHLKQQKSPQDWNAIDRLQAVLEVQNLDDEKFGEFLRRSGLHSHDVESWKSEALGAAEKVQRGRPKLDPELVTLRQELASLKKNLRRKDKALAEASALIILKKRAEEIWGKDEDEE